MVKRFSSNFSFLKTLKTNHDETSTPSGYFNIQKVNLFDIFIMQIFM